jgi:hypothetical protein
MTERHPGRRGHREKRDAHIYVHWRTPCRILERLRETARREQVSQGTVVMNALEAYFKRKGK